MCRTCFLVSNLVGCEEEAAVADGSNAADLLEKVANSVTRILLVGEARFLLLLIHNLSPFYMPCSFYVDQSSSRTYQQGMENQLQSVST